ncbi:MAG: SLC13 family permease [Candidatus Dadabacteria bacterium]|nr:MAG: SLC13 family permease [Candidatus Dadabacteria bacterium]
MNTLIGTSTNMIINDILLQAGEKGFSLFTPAVLAFPVLLVGIFYLLFFPLFFKKRIKEGPLTDDLDFDVKQFISELTIKKGSPLANKTVAESELSKEGIILLGVVKKGFQFVYPIPQTILREQDRIIIQGDLKKITRILSKYGLEFHERQEASIQSEERENGVKEKQINLIEAVVAARSPLINRTPLETGLRTRYNLSLIAINRLGEVVREQLKNIRIKAGDILILQPLTETNLSLLEELGLVPLRPIEEERYNPLSARISVLIFIAAIIWGTLGSFPISFTCFLGAVLTIVLRIVPPASALRQIDWNVLVFIGAIISLGEGMQRSGLADTLSSFLTSSLVQSQSPFLGVVILYLATVVLTQLISNQAAAAIMVPVAVKAAAAFSVTADPFILSVTVAASSCFLAPFEPALMLTFAAGKYSIREFLAAGLPLLILTSVTCCVAVKVIWGL